MKPFHWIRGPARPRGIHRGWTLPIVALALWLLMPTVVWPATYWFHGVRGRDITVCFAGNAVTARSPRVREIVGHLAQYKYAANIRFVSISGSPIDAVAVSALACPPPTQQSNGNDYYNGDIRVAIPGTNMPVFGGTNLVPGVGCTQQQGDSSWSNPPDELALRRSCQYNLVLGDDHDAAGTPYLNHTLHEFGHALGLAHEHARADENAQCVPAGIDGYHSITTGYITPYDKNSVMHYWWDADRVPNCQQTGSNYSHAGLTDYDKLAVHIMYPEDVRVAEFYGNTVLRVGETLQLVSAWQARGANMNFVTSNWSWRVDGTQRSTTPSLNLAGLAAGDHTLEVSHKDFLNRTYTYSGKVRVVTADNYKRLAATQAANAAALAPIITTVNLPAVLNP